MSTLRRRLSRVFASLALLCAACSRQAMVDRIAPPAADRFARSFVEQLRAGDTARMARTLSPRLAAKAGTLDTLLGLREIFAAGATDSIEMVDARVQRLFQERITRRLITYQLRSPGGWTGVELELIEELGLRYVDGVFVTRLDASARQLNAFTLAGKGPAHYLILLLAGGAAAFSLSAAVRVARTPMPRRWWWAALALVGAGQIGIDWTTGEVFTRAFMVELFSGGYGRVGLLGPWIVTASFPVGALIALDRRRRARETAAAPVPPAEAREATSSQAPVTAMPSAMPSAVASEPMNEVASATAGDVASAAPSPAAGDVAAEAPGSGGNLTHTERLIFVAAPKLLLAVAVGGVGAMLVLSPAFRESVDRPPATAVQWWLPVAVGIALLAYPWAALRGRPLPGGRPLGALLIGLAAWFSVGALTVGGWLPIGCALAVLALGVNQLRPVPLLRVREE